MESKRKFGGTGESIAEKYLVNCGFKILDTNWYHSHLELDIVAKDKDELVIVEVRTRNGVQFDHPSEVISNTKIGRIIEAADAYITEHDIDLETRFDLITIVFNGDDFELEHFEDAFYPTL